MATLVAGLAENPCSIVGCKFGHQVMVLFLQWLFSSCVVSKKHVQVTPACITLTDKTKKTVKHLPQISQVTARNMRQGFALCACAQLCAGEWMCPCTLCVGGMRGTVTGDTLTMFNMLNYICTESVVCYGPRCVQCSLSSMKTLRVCKLQSVYILRL